MELFYILLILLLVTRVFGELAERLGQPALVGELVAGVGLGILIRTSAAQFPTLANLTEDPVFHALTELGVFFLMLIGGLELKPRDLQEASKGALAVALGGMLLPLAAGFGLGWAFLPKSDVHVTQCLFVGTALAITAVPVAMRVLRDLGQLKTPMGNLIISAALFDDIFSLILLAILTGVIESGTFPEISELALLIVNVLVFFGVTVAAGFWLFPQISRWLPKMRQEEFEFTGVLLAAFAFSVLAEYLGLHFILGAFMAGLFFERRTVGDRIFEDVTRKVSGISTGFLAPIFFASIGLHLQLSAVTEIPLFLSLLVAAAFLSKLIGSGLTSHWCGFGRTESWAIGTAMSARGAVELIIADVALQAGLFSTPSPPPPAVKHLFSATVIVAILTTIATPVILRGIISTRDEKEGD